MGKSNTFLARREFLPATERVLWVDALRGVVIIVIIVMHGTIIGFTHVSDRWWIDFFDRVLIPVRMPLMMFLAGLLIPHSLARGTGRFLFNKTRYLLYPYLIWSVISLVVVATGKLLGGLDAPINPLDILVSPRFHLWFVSYLFVFCVAAAILRRIHPLASALGALAIACVWPEQDWHRLWISFCFFLLGISATRLSVLWPRIVGSRASLWLVPFVGLSLVASALVSDTSSLTPLTVPLGVGGIIAACALAARFTHRKIFAPFASVGRDSIVYYLAHYVVIRMLCIVLIDRLGWPPAMGVTLSVALTLLICRALVIASRRYSLVKSLFQLPTRSRG